MNEIESTGNPLVDAALSRMRARNDQRFRDIEDSLLVQAHMEKRWAAQLKGHAEWLEEHDKALKEHDTRMKDIDIRLAEMTEKVNFLLDREMKREGGPEARS